MLNTNFPTTCRLWSWVKVFVKLVVWVFVILFSFLMVVDMRVWLRKDSWISVEYLWLKFHRQRMAAGEPFCSGSNLIIFYQKAKKCKQKRADIANSLSFNPQAYIHPSEIRIKQLTKGNSLMARHCWDLVGDIRRIITQLTANSLLLPKLLVITLQQNP